MNTKALWASLPAGAKVSLSIVGAVGTAAVVMVATVAATGAPLLAASPSPSPSSNPATANCNSFIGHVASNLGKSPAQVNKAITDAIGQTLNDAVKNGNLTQAQADAIKAKLNGRQPCSGGPQDRGILGGRHGLPGFGPGPGVIGA